MKTETVEQRAMLSSMELLEALESFKAAFWGAKLKLSVRNSNHYRLMCQDAQAGTLIHKIREGEGND